MKLYTNEQVNELIEDLTKCFLSHNIECDGPHCMGCWKDIVRETIKKALLLPSIELPSDEEIEQFASEFYDNNYTDAHIKIGANWVLDKIKNQQ